MIFRHSFSNSLKQNESKTWVSQEVSRHFSFEKVLPEPGPIKFDHFGRSWIIEKMMINISLVCPCLLFLKDLIFFEESWQNKHSRHQLYSGYILESKGFWWIFESKIWRRIKEKPEERTRFCRILEKEFFFHWSISFWPQYSVIWQKSTIRNSILSTQNCS